MTIKKLTPHAPDFPDALRVIPQPPRQLFVLGDVSLLAQSPKLAVIGTRKVTPYGRGVTERLVRQVSGQGVTIISGLALGVDALAHQAALDGKGKTIAVLPCGLDKPYPATNRQLARRILEQGGALVSEYPIGVAPLQHHFIERNRLVSGLSDGVLITEAAQKSGTTHTAGFALDQGKTVMAVPGNITSELSRGTNSLIKTGALPITDAQDILEALGYGQQLGLQEVIADNTEQALILNLLRQGIADGDELHTQSQLSPPLFNQTLTMLELHGKIRALGANQWALTGS